MANTFLQIMLDDLEDGIRRKIHNFASDTISKIIQHDLEKCIGHRLS